MENALQFLVPSLVLLTSSQAFAWTVETGTNPAKGEVTAVQEVSNYLEQATTSFTLGGEPVGKIHVGRTDFAAGHGLDAADLREEQWVVKSFGPDVVILGGSPRGTLYGVYHFLEDVVGCRFFSPNEEYVPAARPLALGGLDLAGEPKFLMRTLYRGGEYPRGNDKIRGYARRRLNVIEAIGGDAERYGGEVRIAPDGPHNVFQYLPVKKYFAAHPDWYSEIGGKRQPVQLCLSNREMRREFLKSMKDLIARKRVRLYSVGQNDDTRHCTCTNCAAFAKLHGESGLLLDFLNELAREVVKIDPAIRLRTMAYTYTVEPPKGIVAEPNVIVRLCNTHGTNHLTGRSGKFERLLRGWSSAVSMLQIHEYEILFNSSYPECPWPNEFSFPKIFRLWADNKAKGVNIELEDYLGADAVELKAYLLSMYAEDPYRTDFDALIDDYCRTYYGAAGADAAAYRRKLDALATASKAHISWMCAGATGNFRYIQLADILEFERLFDRMERAVQDDPVRLKRVGRLRLAVDWQLGFELFRDYKAAWARENPGRPFPLDLKQVRARALANYGKKPHSRYTYISENDPDPAPSPKFAGRPQRDIAACEIRALEMVKDPDAELGFAGRIGKGNKPSFGLHMAAGQNFRGWFAPFKQENVKPGYNWYCVGGGRFLDGKGLGCNLILTSSWSQQYSLYACEGLDYTKPFEIWARYKMEGGFLYFDRVTVVNAGCAGR